MRRSTALVLEIFNFNLDEKHCSVWPLSSAHLPPSPLSSPDSQVVTEEEDEDFYQEDSALVIKEEAGPEVGAVLSLPQPAFSTPCKLNLLISNLILILTLKFYSQLAKLLLWSGMDF